MQTSRTLSPQQTRAVCMKHSNEVFYVVKLKLMALIERLRKINHLGFYVNRNKTMESLMPKAVCVLSLIHI